jgi:hypothetical protein
MEMALGTDAGSSFSRRTHYPCTPVRLGVARDPTGDRHRHGLATQIRCIITEHRIRTGCAQAWIQTRYGRLPIILLTIPQPRGERAYIWCPAGISLEDFEEARNVLRSACWASGINVTSSSRYSHIVILDVIRREDAQ